MTNHSQSSAEKIAEKFIDAKDLDKIKEASEDIKEDLHGLTRAVRGLASDSLQRAQAKVSEAYEKSQKSLESAEKNLKLRIRSKPMQSLLVAAGVGFLLGWLRRK